jgi:hypothetical protein
MIENDVIVHLDFTLTSYQPTPLDHVQANVTIVTDPPSNLHGILTDTTRTRKCQDQRTNR